MKKILSIALVVVLLAGMAVTGTMAYLQDTDSDVNVMTLGNVYIEQHEYERVLNDDGTYEMITSEKYGEGYKLQEFTQAKPLYPATGAITGWGTKVPFDQIEGASGAQAVFAGLNNVQDKFVLVENTGKTDAYVRTLIALEYGSNTKDIIGISTGDFWTWNEVGVIEIDGNNYYLYEAIYKGSDTRHIGGILPAGEYTYNSLGQIYMASEATNEDVEALDGNKNGTYDILVLSQAVQTAGFDKAETALDTAFGDVNVENCTQWFGGDEFEVPTAVATAEELTAALAAGESVYLTEDVVLTETVNIDNSTNINLNGKNLTVSVLEAKADTTISNGTVTHGESTYPALSVSEGTLTMENVEVICDKPCNIVTSGSAEAAEFAAFQIWSGKAVLNNCDIVAKTDKIRYSNSIFGIGIHGGELTMNGGSITVESHGSTKSQYDYQGAIFAGSAPEKTVNLNDVQIKLGENGKLLFAWGGNTTVNTTAADGTWTAEKIDARNGSTYTINYVK